METGIYYDGYDIPLTYREGVPTAEACRSYCNSEKDAPFFSWRNGYCTCKSSNAGRAIRFSEDVSGAARGCSGPGEPNQEQSNIEALDMMFNPTKIPQYLAYLQMAETEIRSVHHQKVSMLRKINSGTILT